jgi:hypothetical protein
MVAPVIVRELVPLLRMVNVFEAVLPTLTLP